MIIYVAIAVAVVSTLAGMGVRSLMDRFWPGTDPSVAIEREGDAYWRGWDMGFEVRNAAFWVPEREARSAPGQHRFGEVYRPPVPSEEAFGLPAGKPAPATEPDFLPAGIVDKSAFFPQAGQLPAGGAV